jgi:hypothetical protein
MTRQPDNVYSAGIIPFCIEQRTQTIFILLGRDAFRQCQRVSLPLASFPSVRHRAAVRECCEESLLAITFSPDQGSHMNNMFRLKAQIETHQHFALRMDIVICRTPYIEPKDEIEESGSEEESEDTTERSMHHRATLPMEPGIQVPADVLFDSSRELKTKPPLFHSCPKRYIRVYYLVMVPFDPKVNQRFQERREALLRVPAYARAEDLPPNIRGHPAFDPETCSVLPDHLEKDRLQWFSLNHLMELLEQLRCGIRNPEFVIRPSFIPALRTTVTKLAELQRGA